MAEHKIIAPPQHHTKDEDIPAQSSQDAVEPLFLSNSASAALPIPPPHLTPRHVMSLQRTIGNQATQQVIRQIQRQPDPLEAKKDKWYGDVALVIIQLAEREGISIQQAMFVVAQAQAEQGIGDPSKSQYRIFNTMPTFQEEKDLKLNPKEGITTKRIKAAEERDGKIVMLESPFYVYDSLETSVGHYFERLDERYKDALKVLKDSQGKIDEFAKALQKKGYATASGYIPHVIKQYGIVLKEMKAFFGKQIQEEGEHLAQAGAALTMEWDIVIDLWKELNEYKAQRQQSTDDATMRDIENKISDIETQLKEHETVLSEIETFMKDRKEQVKKLEKMRDDLDGKSAAADQP